MTLAIAVFLIGLITTIAFYLLARKCFKATFEHEGVFYAKLKMRLFSLTLFKNENINDSKTEQKVKENNHPNYIYKMPSTGE
jgi:hypothetical protein